MWKLQMVVIEKSGEFGSIYIVISCFRYFTSDLLNIHVRKKGYSDIYVGQLEFYLFNI